MKKKFMIFTTILLVCMVFIGFSANIYAAPSNSDSNILESTEKIRVIIGSDFDTGIGLDQYNIQADELRDVSGTQSSNIPALITFNRYLSVTEAQELLRDVDKITVVYLWTPNKTGRSIIDVQDNDLTTTIDDYFDSFDLNDIKDPVFINDIIELKQNYGIFAVEVKAEYSQLQSITDNPDISRVDLIQSTKAVSLSLQSNKPVVYICIPEKPDGTQ